MKRRIVRSVGLILIICILLILIVSFKMARTHLYSIYTRNTYELNFYINLLHSLHGTNRIYIADLIPLEWDTMKVFSAYATKEDKISYAGYEYCDTLRDINYEDIISFVFMKDGSVVYYIDALVPRAFDIQSLDENTVKISLSSGVSATVNSSEIYLIDNWGYNASFSETTFENRPYFDVVYLENSSVMLSLLNDK